MHYITCVSIIIDNIAYHTYYLGTRLLGISKEICNYWFSVHDELQPSHIPVEPIRDHFLHGCRFQTYNIKNIFDFSSSNLMVSLALPCTHLNDQCSMLAAISHL